MTTDQAWRWVEARDVTVANYKAFMILLFDGHSYMSTHTDRGQRIIECVQEAQQMEVISQNTTAD